MTPYETSLMKYLNFKNAVTEQVDAGRLDMSATEYDEEVASCYYEGMTVEAAIEHFNWLIREANPEWAMTLDEETELMFD